MISQRFDHGMYMIGHHTPRVQQIPLALKKSQCAGNQISDIRLPQPGIAQTPVQDCINLSRIPRPKRLLSVPCMTRFFWIGIDPGEQQAPLFAQASDHFRGQGIRQTKGHKINRAFEFLMRQVTARVIASEHERSPTENIPSDTSLNFFGNPMSKPEVSAFRRSAGILPAILSVVRSTVSSPFSLGLFFKKRRFAQQIGWQARCLRYVRPRHVRLPRTNALLLFFLSLMPAVLAAAPADKSDKYLILEYTFDEASDNDVVARDSGPLARHLSIGSALSRSLPGAGAEGGGGGGRAIGRTGDRDVFMSSPNPSSGARLDGLVSFTLCGWYKLNFNQRTRGTIFQLVPVEGNGFQLHFGSKQSKSPNQWLMALVSVVGPGGTNLHTGEGVSYSAWDDAFSRMGEWIFFALVFDAANDARLVEFYVGSETSPVRLVGRSKRASHWTRDFTLGRIGSIHAANTMDSAAPIPMGTYLDNLRLFGARSGGVGALSREELERLRQRDLSGQSR